MPLEGTYEPSTQQWVRDQVELYESSGGTEGTLLRGMPVVVMTNRGAKSGNLRKTPLMRVEHEGVYAVVASQGGADEHPAWYFNLLADPQVELQDGPIKRDYVAANFASRTMRWTGIIVALFIVFHLLHLTTGTVQPVAFEEHDVYANVIGGA